ncbi:MAG: hypothetical protein QHI38_07495 [Armatimonadota bacterium]|nr:hypothetical protein [Armatimonadota bacterium]
MIKFLFFDYSETEIVTGFRRELQQPKKYEGNPLFIADKPWENGNMQLYGSAIKAPGKPFQLWYSVVHKPFTMLMAYAESDDGIEWHRPELDIYEYEGSKTNIVFTADPHGPAVIYDEADPREDWKYKMMCGAAPSRAICAFRSSDGIHWVPVRKYPVISTDPDCPMALYRTPDGRFAAHHRLSGYGRRVFRSESWDFLYWSDEPRMIMEPDAGDPPQIQFYGMGATSYGSYEIGTLWIYHTRTDDFGLGKMHGYQEAELTYARQGYCWHRAAQGRPFIPHGEPGSWEQGNLQCASAPIFLDNEIRYYYMGTTAFHQTRWELVPQTAGIGMASLRPDGFVALTAGEEPAELLTTAFTPDAPYLHVNARTKSGGWLRIEVLTAEGEVMPGYSESECVPITGDGTRLLVKWAPDRDCVPVDHPIRLRVTAKNASLFSIFSSKPEEAGIYWKFRGVKP